MKIFSINRNFPYFRHHPQTNSAVCRLVPLFGAFSLQLLGVVFWWLGISNVNWITLRMGNQSTKDLQRSAKKHKWKASSSIAGDDL